MSFHAQLTQKSLNGIDCMQQAMFRLARLKRVNKMEAKNVFEEVQREKVLKKQKEKENKVQETRMKPLKTPLIATTGTKSQNPFTNTKHSQRTRNPQMRYNLRKRSIPDGSYACNLRTLSHIYDSQGRKIKILDLLHGTDSKRWNRNMSSRNQQLYT